MRVISNYNGKHVRQAFEVQAGLIIEARPGWSLTDHYKAGDSGTVTKIEDGKAYVTWDRSGKTSWTTLTTFHEKLCILKAAHSRMFAISDESNVLILSSWARLGKPGKKAATSHD